jgi:hypothetical protein
MFGVFVSFFIILLSSTFASGSGVSHLTMQPGAWGCSSKFAVLNPAQALAFYKKLIDDLLQKSYLSVKDLSSMKERGVFELPHGPDIIPDWLYYQERLDEIRAAGPDMEQIISFRESKVDN